MNIATNLSGRLRNTSLPLSHGLLPLFEAVINSIHGIEEASVPPVSWRIRIVIEREPSLPLLDGNGDRKSGGHPFPDITGFKVIDNGVGFNEENFQAFLTLDTDHKVAKGGRGIGRLLWLKAFGDVEVESTFDEGDVRRRRTFAFSKAGITGGDSTDAPSGSARGTVVRLRGFAPAYRAKARKTPEAIANALIEHCLWYFVRQGGCPSISIEDDGTLLSLDDLFEQHMHSQAVRQEAKLKGRAFDLLHVKLRASAAPEHAIAYCANNRLVLEEKLAGRVPGLHGSLSDDDGAFTYVCYVNSAVLDERVRPERSAFDLPADVEGLFEGTEIGWTDIRNLVIGEASRHLDAHLGKLCTGGSTGDRGALILRRTGRSDDAADICFTGMGRQGEGDAARALPRGDGRRDSVGPADRADRTALSEGRPGHSADAARADAAHLFLAALVQSVGPGDGRCVV